MVTTQFQCSRKVAKSKILKEGLVNISLETMSSQLAPELMGSLAMEETNSKDFFAKTNLDETSDHSEDEAESPVMGDTICEAGKYKGKKSLTDIYREDKSYVQWVRMST